MLRITALEWTARFEREVKALDVEQRRLVQEALIKLLNCPLPKTLRHHTLRGYRPTVHVVDITPNHAHQITFNMVGQTAVLLRVGTHKQISRSPE